MILSPAASSSATARTIATILPLVSSGKERARGGKECGTGTHCHSVWERVSWLRKCECPVYLPLSSSSEEQLRNSPKCFPIPSPSRRKYGTMADAAKDEKKEVKGPESPAKVRRSGRWGGRVAAPY